MLLIDCMSLWGVTAGVVPQINGMAIPARDGTFVVQRAPHDMRPVRWLLHRPGRGPRVAPSIVALLATLRNALGAEAGNKLTIGSGRSPDYLRRGRT